MKSLSLLAVAAGLAQYAMAAPLGIVVFGPDGKRILVPIADSETDPKNMRESLLPFMIPPPAVIREGENDMSWMHLAGGLGPKVAPEIAHIEIISPENMENVDPPHHAIPIDSDAPSDPEQPARKFRKGGCKKGANGGVRVKSGNWRNKTMRMRLGCTLRKLMNSFRSAFGLPTINFYHRHNRPQAESDDVPHLYSIRPDGTQDEVFGPDGKPCYASRPHPHHHHHHGEEEGPEHFKFMEDTPHPRPHFVHHVEVEPVVSLPFYDRLFRFIGTLGPREAFFAYFLFALGFFSLLRMILVLMFIAVIGRKGLKARRAECHRRRLARRDARRCRRDLEASEPLVNALPAPPPPPAYVVDEKPKVAVEEAKVETPVFREIVTVEPTKDGLILYYIDTAGTEHNMPVNEFGALYPQELIKFYESNLKWRPVSEDAEEETHQ